MSDGTDRQEVEHRARVLASPAEPASRRAAAARSLAGGSDPRALAALLAAARDPAVPAPVARAAGRAAARVLYRLDQVASEDLADFTAEAYQAFDDEVARRLHAER